MRINVRITLDDSDLTLEEIAYILAGGDTPVATVADDIETVETVQEEIEIEEPEIVEETPEPEIVEEPEVEPEVEPEEEEQEETQDEVVTEPVTKKPKSERKPRARLIRPTQRSSRGRKRRHTSVNIPQGVFNRKDEPKHPELEDIKGTVTKARIVLLKENNINTVGEFMDADEEDLLRIMQMNWKQDTEIGLAKRTANALLRSFEKEWTAYQRTQIARVDETPSKPKQFEHNEHNLFLEVWNNIPMRRAGVFDSFTIALSTISRIEHKYENGNDVKHQDVLSMANKVIQAIYQQADSPEFMLGGDEVKYLVVLTDTKWPSRNEIEKGNFESEA